MATTLQNHSHNKRFEKNKVAASIISPMKASSQAHGKGESVTKVQPQKAFK
jgi:hypothetical protein